MTTTTPTTALADLELPPLPEPKYCADYLADIFTTEQMQQYARDAIAASRRVGGEVLQDAAQAINRLLGAVEGLSYVDSAREFGERTLANILRITEAAPASAGQAAPAIREVAQLLMDRYDQLRGERTCAAEFELLRSALATQPAEGAGQAERRIKYLESLVDAYGPKSLQYDIEHPNDGLNSADPDEVSRTARNLPKSEGAGQAGQVAKGKRLSESAVRQLALTHASAASGGEHYEFDQQGMDAFAIDIMVATIERAAAPAEQTAVARNAERYRYLRDVLHAEVDLPHYSGAIDDGEIDEAMERLGRANQQPSAQKGGDREAE